MIEVCRIPQRIVGTDRMSQTLVTPTAAMLKVNRLFHYQKFNAEWLRMAVFDSKVRFSNPENFNDPWDCQPFFHIPTESEPELRERYIEWLCSRSRKHDHDISEGGLCTSVRCV